MSKAFATASCWSTHAREDAPRRDVTFSVAHRDVEPADLNLELLAQLKLPVENKRVRPPQLELPVENKKAPPSSLELPVANKKALPARLELPAENKKVLPARLEVSIEPLHSIRAHLDRCAERSATEKHLAKEIAQHAPTEADEWAWKANPLSEGNDVYASSGSIVRYLFGRL